MSSLDNMPINNALSEEYKLTTEPVVLDNATEYEWNEIQSDTLNQPQGTNWRLQLKNISQYCNPAKAYLEVKIRLTDAADANLGPGINASLQNHILSLFSRATLRVGGQLVESVNECHIAKALVQPLLHYSQDYASSSGTNEMFYKDGPGFGVVKVPYDGDENRADFNGGFRKRFDRTDNKEVTAWVPLSSLFGFCTVDRVLVNNTFIVELVKSAQKDHVLSTAGTEKVAINKVSVWMPQIQAKPTVDLAIKTAMSDGVASNYMFPHFQSYSILGVNGNNNFRIVTSSEKVLYAFVLARAPARTATSSTAQTLDNVQTLELRLNGRAYPSQNYVNLKGTTEDKARAYADLMRYMSRGYDYSSGIPLSYEEWEKTTIYAFDMTSQPEPIGMSSPATVELKSVTDAQVEWSVCVLSEKRVQVNYQGSSAVVLVN